MEPFTHDEVTAARDKHAGVGDDPYELFGRILDLQCELNRVQAKLDALRALLPEVDDIEEDAQQAEDYHDLVTLRPKRIIALTAAIRVACDEQGDKESGR